MAKEFVQGDKIPVEQDLSREQRELFTEEDPEDEDSTMDVAAENANAGLQEDAETTFKWSKANAALARNKPPRKEEEEEEEEEEEGGREVLEEEEVEEDDEDDEDDEEDEPASKPLKRADSSSTSSVGSRLTSPSAKSSRPTMGGKSPRYVSVPKPAVAGKLFTLV